MSRTKLTLLWMLFATGVAPARDLAAEVRSVFAAKCAGCHGPDLAKPKGRFGYVLDLARVAANREMVVPSAPDESELWVLVRRNEMPPDDAPSGPLTEEQKEVIRAWIAAGAPAAASGATDPTPPPAPNPSKGASSATRALRWLGRLHILVIHFPIALLIAAAAGEAWSALRGSRTSATAVRFCVALGAAGAVAAAALGWLHAWGGHGAGMPAVLGLHRWLGTAAGAWAVTTALQLEWDVRRGRRSLPFRASFFLGALLVGVAGHFGGILVHGDDFLSAG
jgi:mono/diheme cytochrome c family protein